ncbi:MAG: DUF5915 domain-containing protein, partial [Planctomycetota bacterium]
YRNLVADQDDAAPQSVHLCEYPEPTDELVDEELSRHMDVVTSTVSAVLGIRMAEQIRVRQPLRELTIVAASADKADALRRFQSQVLEELNVKALTFRESAEGIETLEVLPNMAALGPKHTSLAGKVADAIGTLDPAAVAASVAQGEAFSVNVDGVEYAVEPEEVEVRRGMPEHLAMAEVNDVKLILDAEVTPELRAEGWARDTVRHIQQYRKELDLNIEDRIHLRYEAGGELAGAIESWRDYIMAETLSVLMEAGVGEGASKAVRIGGTELQIQVEKARAD